jgi:hypothetical protein
MSLRRRALLGPLVLQGTAAPTHTVSPVDPCPDHLSSDCSDSSEGLEDSFGQLRVSQETVRAVKDSLKYDSDDEETTRPVVLLAPISPGGFTSIPAAPRSRVVERRPSFQADTLSRTGPGEPEWRRPLFNEFATRPPFDYDDDEHSAEGLGSGGSTPCATPAAVTSEPVTSTTSVIPVIVDPLATAPPPEISNIQEGSIVSFCLSHGGLHKVAPPAARGLLPDICSQHFLGLVFASNQMDDNPSYSDSFEVFIAFISRKPPTSPGDIARCAPLVPKANHSVPLGTQTRRNNTNSGKTSRSPLASRVKFPWRDYVVWTTLGVRARLLNPRGIHGAPVVLDQEEVERFRLCLSEDLQAQIAEFNDKGGARGASGSSTSLMCDLESTDSDRTAQPFTSTRYSGCHTLPVEIPVSVSLDIGLAGGDAPDPSSWYENESVVLKWITRG